MGYVAVTGGTEAILKAEELLKYFRLKGNSQPIGVTQIRDQLRLAVDKVMGEGSLYAPTYAALALKQAEGDTIEASFILRAYRSTQLRRYYSRICNTTGMEIVRRISATFQDVPGGQILGPTRDYTQRLLDFSLSEENKEQVEQFLTGFCSKENKGEYLPLPIPKVVNLLRAEGLLEESLEDNRPVFDITREALVFPAPRSARLQSLARGETGAMMALAYSSIRGYGNIHPALGELRVGYVALEIHHPVSGDPVYVGKVMVTEAEVISEKYGEAEPGVKPKLSLGYGLCFGHNELKAIAMGILDRSIRSKAVDKSPAEDEEFVLYHIDGIEGSGFVSHWKLPHYVTFQSALDRLRKSQINAEEAAEDVEEACRPDERGL